MLPTIAQLRACLERSGQQSLQSLRALLSGWEKDSELIDMFADVEDVLEHRVLNTRKKDVLALRRLGEYVAWLPLAVQRAAACHDMIDFVLAGFVGSRCRVHKRRVRPIPWRGSAPMPSSVRSEVNAIVGLTRAAGMLPADPKGTIPRTRMTMKRCGCCNKYDASPRAYTVGWELAAARRMVPFGSVRMWAVWCIASFAIGFLLRPLYARTAGREHITGFGGGRWQLRWDQGDKTAPAPIAPHVPQASDEDDPSDDGESSGSSSSAASAAGAAAVTATAARRRPARKPIRISPVSAGLPKAHPRRTASAAPMLDIALREWIPIRGPCEPGEPLFCRIEDARNPDRCPGGARAVKWRGKDCWLWPKTPLSSAVIKAQLTSFLTPIVGQERAAKRVFSGLRGGGETELLRHNTPIHVRATIGWWRARLLSQQGALVTYEGAGMEEMWQWTRKIGSSYLRFLDPGVYTITPPIPRSIRQRCIYRGLPRPSIVHEEAEADGTIQARRARDPRARVCTASSATGAGR